MHLRCDAAATTMIMMSDITSLFTAHDHILGFMIRNGYVLKIYEKKRLLIAMRPKMRSPDVLTLYSGLQRSQIFVRACEDSRSENRGQN